MIEKKEILEEMNNRSREVFRRVVEAIWQMVSLLDQEPFRVNSVKIFQPQQLEMLCKI